LREIVIDASVAAAVLITDEWTPLVVPMQELLGTARLHAPMHWPMEIASVIVNAERRGRLTAADRARYLSEARDLQAVLDLVSSEPSMAITDLAIATGLSVYDAAYLEVALRLNCELATNDRKLITAATAGGVAVLSTLAALP